MKPHRAASGYVLAAASASDIVQILRASVDSLSLSLSFLPRSSSASVDSNYRDPGQSEREEARRSGRREFQALGSCRPIRSFGIEIESSILSLSLLYVYNCINMYTKP